MLLSDDSRQAGGAVQRRDEQSARHAQSHPLLRSRSWVHTEEWVGQWTALDSPSMGAAGVLLANVKGKIYSHYLATSLFRWRKHLRHIETDLAPLGQNSIIRTFQPDVCKYLQNYDGLHDKQTYRRRYRLLRVPYNSHYRSRREEGESFRLFLRCSPTLARARMRGLSNKESFYSFRADLKGFN